MHVEPHSNGRHSIYAPVCRDERRERHLQTEMRKYTGFCAFLRISPSPIQAPLLGSIPVFRFLFLREGENTAGTASNLPVWPRGPPITPPGLAHCWVQSGSSEQSGEQRAFTPPALALPSALPAPPCPQLWDSSCIFCFASFQLPAPPWQSWEAQRASACGLEGCGGQGTPWPCWGSSTS